MAGVVALHELAHIAALTLCGARVRSLDLRVYGVRLDCDLSALSRVRQTAVYLCAPLLNLILGAAWFVWDPMSIAGAASLCVGAFNLLPIPPLDGGAAAAVWLDGRRGALLLRAAGALCLLPVLACALWLCARRGNFTLLVCAGYLLACALLRR